MNYKNNKNQAKLDIIFSKLDLDSIFLSYPNMRSLEIKTSSNMINKFKFSKRTGLVKLKKANIES